MTAGGLSTTEIAGQLSISARMVALHLQRADTKTGARHPADQTPLTPREMQVAQLVALTGLSPREAAGRLAITENTVKCHLKRIYAKTGAGGGRGRGAPARARLAKWLRQGEPEGKR